MLHEPFILLPQEEQVQHSLPSFLPSPEPYKGSSISIVHLYFTLLPPGGGRVQMYSL
jgi:hypothetical protein